MLRTEIYALDDLMVPAHLRATIGAALAAKMRVSLWQVREFTVAHVFSAGEWRIFMPIERDSDALEVYTRIGHRRSATLSMQGNRVTARFEFDASSTEYTKDYHNDMGAALRGAITNAALKLYKHEQTHNLI